ncbi:serine/threonine protein kinase, partial [Corallococcus sp. 4LFB]
HDGREPRPPGRPEARARRPGPRVHPRAPLRLHPRGRRPAGTQQLAQHDVHLSPGPHTLTVSCGYCEDATETIDVKPGGENVFRLRALLKSSQLALDYQPPDATVRVGDTERTARDSLQRPFDIRSPRGPASFQHRVEVEISSPGYKTEKRVVLLEPGKPTTLRGSLAPE